MIIIKTKITVRNPNDNIILNENVQLASICPCCNVSSVPKVLMATLVHIEDDDDDVVYVFNYCSNCDSCFISCHEYNEDDFGYDFVYSAPQSKSCKEFSGNIKELSPSFIEIYNDSLTAEEEQLTSICGMGYRKALEFLIKDYAVSIEPDAKDSIIKETLSQCIKNHIKDERLKILAQASAWLGNDETHYSKKHSDYNLSDLKTFIDAFVTFIDAELAVAKAQKLLSKH